jgi:hypothetical protein
MDYEQALRDAGKNAADLKRDAKSAEAARDNLIYRAHVHGGMSTREIGPLAGISHQRAAQVIEKIRAN